ncbi:MAG: sulfotransferase [Bacteroidota bacterium]
MTIALDKTIPHPDFLIIGTQKGGTTWLRRMLITHPDIYIPPYPEEVHFFNRAIEQPDLYFALFNIQEAGGKLLGEKSPNYFHMPEKAIRFVKTLLPEVKLVVILRNPVERAWSQARMNTSDFNQKELGKKNLLKLVLQVASRGNFERTNYAKVLQKWLKSFDQEQLLLYYYDDLQNDSQQFLNRVCDDLKMPHFTPEELQKRVHVSKSLQMPAALRWFLTWRYRKIPKQLKQLDFKAPETWSEQKTSISFLQKVVILMLFFPYHILTSLGYQLYKLRSSQKLKVPRIIFD